MDDWEGSSYDPLTLHKYLYTSGDPVNGNDPSGHDELAEEMGAVAASGTLTAMSIQIASSALIAGTAFRYLPKDAFLKKPSGDIVGFQGSYPIGKLLSKFPQNPFIVGLAIGFQFSAGVAGLEFLELDGSSQPWLYSAWGLSIGVSDGTQSITSGGNSPFNLNGFALAAAYEGKAYNVTNPGDYAGPFYCVSGSRGMGQFVGLPVGPNVSVCSSPPKDDGTPGAYSWSVSPMASQGFGVGTAVTRYSYLWP